MADKNVEDLRLYVLAHFPNWINKSPLYFDNIKHELPGFIESLQKCFKENNINSFNMDWLLNMTPLEIRSKVKKIKEAKDNLEFIIWEDKVLRTIKEGSKDEILYYALLMYLDLRDSPLAQIPKLEQPNKTDNEIQVLKNPYPQIFPDAFSYRLFERLHNDYKNSTNLLADFSFIYRKMYELEHIVRYQKPEMFRDWLSKEPFNVILDNKFKTLDRCKTHTKETNFNTVIELVRKEGNSVP